MLKCTCTGTLCLQTITGKQIRISAAPTVNQSLALTTDTCPTCRTDIHATTVTRTFGITEQLIGSIRRRPTHRLRSRAQSVQLGGLLTRPADCSLVSIGVSSGAETV